MRLCLGTQIIHSGARLSLAAAGSLSVCTAASSGTPLAGGLAWWAIGELLAIHPQAAFEEYANLVVYVAIGAHLFDNLTGTSELLSVILVFVLLALVLTGLIVAIVDTVRLRRASAAVRALAAGCSAL